MIRQEDFARDPISRFRELYSMLGLNFTPHVEKEIANSSSSENPAELSLKKTHSVKMDSLASIQNWKKRLAPENVQRIRSLTEGVSELYYADEAWE